VFVLLPNLISTSCCLYRSDPPDDERHACSKHIEACYWNKLIENSSPCWFILYEYVTMHGQQNIKNQLPYLTVLHLFVSVLACPERTAVRSQYRGF
jgi:hypothetical protein